MARKERMKGRVIFLKMHKNGEPVKCYMGSSVAQIALKAGMHKMTLTRGSRLAEESPDGCYETTNYFMFVTSRDGFIKGLTHGGNFAYTR
jgi:hypothetical protein